MAEYLDDDLDTEESEEDTGKGLRAQLEKTLRENRKLQGRLDELETRDLLTTEGLDLVKAEDLAGLSGQERRERAAELQDQRRAMQEDLLRQALGRFVEDESALEDMVAEAVGKASAESEVAGQVARARTLGGLDSQPVPAVDPRKLHGAEAIRFAIGQQKKPARKVI